MWLGWSSGLGCAGCTSPGGVSIREVQRRTGLGRNTIRRALRRDRPLGLSAASGRPSLIRVKSEVQRLLREDPELPTIRVLELIAKLGVDGGKTLVYDYVAELRRCSRRRHAPSSARFAAAASCCSSTCGNPAGWCRSAMARPAAAGVVVAALGFSRAGAGTLIFSKEAPDILAGLWRCITRLGGLPQTLVIDREGALHARRWTADRGVRGVLRRAQGRLALLRAP